ncbi:MAG: phosphodiester glycosidase family protein, partial [Selenomonadaceae bacterium]|nr:phosphodiester glycosidase family protein [Selenomonadaceae bacterium]
LAALFMAGIFFLSSPSFAQAEEFYGTNVPTKPPEGVPQSIDEDNPPPSTADKPEENAHGLDPEYYDPPVYAPGEEPPQTTTPPPVDDGEGLEFLVYHQNGVMAFAIIADHEKYQLRPVLARGQVPGRATVSQMNAPDAIATINASYFAPNGIILGNTKIDGLTVGTTYFIRSAIGIRADGSTIFARQTYRGVLQFNGEEVAVAGVDCERNANTVVVYNGWYGATTGTNDFGVELVVQDGVVVNIFRDKGNNYIPPDGFIVSAHGTTAENFKDVYVGDTIIFDEDYINVEHGEDFNEAIHIIGAGPTLVKDGEIYVTADAEQFPSDIRVGRAPRSAVGITKYGDYIFAVVDGRQAHSKGCTLTEWARILKNNFGAVEAINLDGGGSTELFFKGSLVNMPSDGRERLVGDALTILPK